MEFIAHRINKVLELINIPKEYGVELDLRDSFDGKIYIQHNPFEKGDDFEDYLKEYHHGTMILNIKSERIEFAIIELLKKYRIDNYFFLDSSFPMINLLSSNGINDIALRVSEFEGLDTVFNMRGKCNWVWIDCFSKIPIEKKDFDKLKECGYKLCFVSPELEGRPEDIEKYAAFIKQEGMLFDAICTKEKNISRWKHLL